MYRITLTYDKRLLRRAVLGFCWRVTGFRFFATLTLLAAALGMLLHEGDRSWFTGMLASVLALCLALTLTMYVGHYRNALRKLAAMGSPVGVLELAESSLSISSGAGASTLPWSSIKEIWRFKGYWLCLISKAQFFTIRLTDVSPQAADFMLDRVHAAGGKIS